MDSGHSEVPEGQPPGLRGLDDDLDRLRARLQALHESIETLGRDDPPPVADRSRQPAAAPPPQPPVLRQPPPLAPPQPPDRPARPQRVTIPSAHHPVEETPPEADQPDSRGQRSEPDSAVSAVAVSASFVRVDARPFEGLAELHRFERALADLPSVREVRLRRFRGRRAELVVGVCAVPSLGEELAALPAPIEIESYRGERIVIRLGRDRPAGDPSGEAGE